MSAASALKYLKFAGLCVRMNVNCKEGAAAEEAATTVTRAPAG